MNSKPEPRADQANLSVPCDQNHEIRLHTGFTHSPVPPQNLVFLQAR